MTRIQGQQLSPVTGVTRSTGGNPSGGVTVTVTKDDDPAVVYSDPELTEILEDVVSDGQGVFSFYAFPGTYVLDAGDGMAGLEDVEVADLDPEQAGVAQTAGTVAYDNTDSGLTAETTQAAVDELTARVAALEGP